ncbi:MAG: UvrD-helicase domain-containing protein [Bacteroidia bacterium]|nr:UvrD-helicase domain-containing protein [Bacteroidia bacterium]MDW8016002.1 UvrD-helicase domain-containing protein [Bacteroidia bacterium]
MSLQVILASAGAGKTQSLANLAIKTLTQAEKESDSIESKPDSTALSTFPQAENGVLAITFTRNAAAELRARLLNLLFSNPLHQPLAREVILGRAPLYTSTIDALCRELYRSIAPILGIAVYEELIVEEEDYIEMAHTLSRQLLSSLHHPHILRLLRLRLEKEIHERARRILPEALLRRELLSLMEEGPIRLHVRNLLYTALRAGILHELPSEWQEALALDKRSALLFPLLRETLETYRHRYQRIFLSDIIDLLQLTARYIEEILSESTEFYAHLLVDEAQDTSSQHWEILTSLMEELLGRGGKVTLIGDPKQAIYAWREANSQLLMRFWEKADIPSTLSENFRSAPEIVNFNNRLYSKLGYCLRSSIESKAKKDDLKAEIISKIEDIYNAGQVIQTPKREDKGVVQIFRFSSHEGEEKRGEILRQILASLQEKGVPPHETAFLVRSNEHIQRLIGLLPDLPLQVQQIPLRRCTSLWVTMQYLKGEATQVEAHYLSLHPAAPAVEALPRQISAFHTPMKKWEAFYQVAQAWIQGETAAHAPFWFLFLSELYVLLQRHPLYGVEEIGRWWDERMQGVVLNMPPTEGTYPVLTIHRAKGLAWEAIILPYAEWDLLSVRWDRPLWRPVSWPLLPPSLQKVFEESLEILLSKDHQVILPLQIRKSAKDPSLQELYKEYAVERVIENINLHYVATTRPRRYLYLLAASPSEKAYGMRKGQTWRGFWNDKELSGDLWGQNAHTGGALF